MRVAVVGTGVISHSHIAGFLRFPDRCRITALVDIKPERAHEVARAHGIRQAAVLSDYSDLLVPDGSGAQPAVDLVSICLPPSQHAEVAIAFLSRGVHVLVEKPMAPSLQECDRMIEAAEAGGAQLSVVAQNRFINAMVKLKAVLDSQLLGRILYRRVDSVWWRGANYYDLAWRGTWASEGGGPTLNHAVHHIDLFLWMGGAPTEVRAVMANLAHDNSEVEDISIATLGYADGSVAQVTSSVLHHGEQQLLEFQGERGMVSVPWAVAASTPLENGFPARNEDLEQRLHALYRSTAELTFEGHTAQIQDVLQALETGRTPLVDGAAGRRTMELITAIYKAATSGETVKLPLSREDAFYTKERLLEQVPRFHSKTHSVEGFSENRITLGRDFNRRSR